MQAFLDAIQSGASGEDIGAIPIPESYRGAFVLREEQGMFEGMASEDKDPRKSLHVDEVATPELAPDEVYVAVMASSINFNTVWTSIFEPLPTSTATTSTTRTPAPTTTRCSPPTSASGASRPTSAASPTSPS
jgi:hypothetical protein